MPINLGYSITGWWSTNWLVKYELAGLTHLLEHYGELSDTQFSVKFPSVTYLPQPHWKVKDVQFYNPGLRIRRQKSIPLSLYLIPSYFKVFENIAPQAMVLIIDCTYVLHIDFFLRSLTLRKKNIMGMAFAFDKSRDQPIKRKYCSHYKENRQNIESCMSHDSCHGILFCLRFHSHWLNGFFAADFNPSVLSI